MRMCVIALERMRLWLYGSRKHPIGSVFSLVGIIWKELPEWDYVRYKRNLRRNRTLKVWTWYLKNITRQIICHGINDRIATCFWHFVYSNEFLGMKIIHLPIYVTPADDQPWHVLSSLNNRLVNVKRILSHPWTSHNPHPNCSYSRSMSEFLLIISENTYRLHNFPHVNKYFLN